ncbi:MAG: alpha-2-macroglobulin family protein [Chitinophagaceae bacterium]
MIYSPFPRTLVIIFLTFFYGTVSFGQKPVRNYETQWKRVEEFTKKGLPKSALEEVRKIYALAKKENQDAQLIKSLVYITGLQQENRDDNEVLSISEIEREIATGPEPARSILQSLLADIYWNYYQQNRWKLYDRTKTENFNKPDIKTWGIEDFHREVSSLYLQSIKDVKLLQRTGLPAFAAILQPGNMRHLRPTLFDLLAHRAISYFANNERDITKPAYAFEISQAGAFDPAADFIRLKFPTDDTASLQQKALLVYQQLIAFHLGDKKPDALIDADLMRLAFVKENSTHPEKDRLYLNSILRLTRQYGILPAASQAWYLLASYYNEQANAYKPHGDTTGRFARLQAKAICEQVLMQKDSSEGKVNCRNLLNEIQRPSFRFTLEKVNLPGKPFRTLVNYRNINKLYLRVIRPGEELKKLLEKQYDPGYWSALAAAPSLSGWEQKLPDTRDFQEHSVELKVEGLPVGEYILLASDSPSFNDPGARLGARFFYVSGISYVNNDDDYFVLDRDHGGPLDGARVDVWIQRYDYSLSKYVREKEKEHRTDKHGFFRMTRKPRDENQYGSFAYQLEITHGQDHLFINENLYDYYYSNTGDSESKPVQSIHLFTDRSLYRPGQTVYFKGIALTRNSREKTGSVLAGFATTVYLRNASFKDIDSILVKTSEYGSFSGRFQLPETGLNGQFTLHTMDIQASAIIRMEEYKRPKFYVDFEPLKGTYKVNDQIRVTGLARAYAGNNVDGATVSYRVVREPRFIYPWMFWRWWQPPAESMEIKHGIARTDKEGKFIVEFTALPDGKIDKKFEPVFDYTIYADVTDINGETRSSSKSVSVSYKALALLVNIPSTLPADSLDKLNLRTQNMNGEFEPSMVNVTLTKIKQEDRLIRERFWQRPDQFVMSKDDYIRLFPNDEYDNETDLVSWAKESQVFNRSDSTRDNLPWALGRKSWTPGFYMIEITTKDRHGEEVRDIKYIELYNEKNESLNRPVYLWKGVQKTGVEPGETALVEFGTAADNLHVIQTIDKDVLQDRARTPEYTFLTMNRNKSTFSFKVSESDRGGFGTGWMFVKHNRVYQHNQVIRVPWTNKDLSVEYMTFREKTLPGSDEKWKIRITGFKKEQVAAEMLASMYDASLDQFYPHNWDEPGIWPSYYSKTAWNSTRNFDFVQSYQKYVSDKISNQLDKRYEQLISISLFGVSYQFRNMVAEEAPPAPLPDQDADGVADTSVNEVVVAATKDTRKQTGKKEGGANEEPGNGKQETQIRRNFNETAFFLPDLRTDSTGAIEFSFTMPEALTRWKFMALAHTRDAAFGNSTKEIVTQKDLMVQPNPPRFMREGDKMEFSSKIVNLTNKEITGTAEFRLFDAFTNEPVDGRFRSMVPNQYFTVGAGQSEVLKFPIEIPYQFNTALVWRIVARAGGYSDGEENTLPVLSNRMLVTETMPLPFRGTGSRNFTFTGLLNSVNSESLQHRSLTVEYTSNPAWYAVQALPYLMDYPYECAEQTWNRYYANSLATFIANSSPRIKQVFEKWKIADTTALLSNLQKNQELKSVLLEETPGCCRPGVKLSRNGISPCYLTWSA